MPMSCQDSMITICHDRMMPRCPNVPSLLSNGDVFHDAVDSNTDLHPSIFNLLHRNDNVLNLEEKTQDLNLKNSNLIMTMWDILPLHFLVTNFSPGQSQRPQQQRMVQHGLGVGSPCERSVDCDGQTFSGKSRICRATPLCATSLRGSEGLILK